MSLIVLEGLDGAGKSTQIRLLQELLTEHGIKSRYLHFPRFDAPIYGELIARFLRGELGAVDAVDPYLVALLYAGDRADAARMIEGWIAEGSYVILDRYLYSNIAYQCAKTDDPTRREQLRQWIIDLEYGYNHIPKPDISLFLDVPFEFTRHKLAEQREGDDRGYLHGQQDIHEASLVLQQRVREVYIDQTRRDASFRVVACADTDGRMLAPEAIFARVRAAIEHLLKSER